MGLRWFLAGVVLAFAVPCSNALAAAGPALSVDASAGRHAISPLIYGWNFVDPALGDALDITVDRRGGNKADTLNWQNGMESTSNDYFFEPLPWCWTECSGITVADAHRAYTDQIDADRAFGAQTVIDLPMLGFVPKEARFDHPFDCSYPKTVFATQDAFDPYDTNCGNGRNGNVFVTDTPQTANAVAADAAFQGGWVDDLVTRYGSAGDGGVRFYELGNEPGLWHDTHHDWHPAPVTYDELWARSQALALEVKTRDPAAKTLSFSEWGWPNYFCSSADDLSDGCQSTDADRAAHGGTDLSSWLLQQYRAWADAHGGQRLIDYFDLHYYRQDNGTPGFRATRSLWDPAYSDESWIGEAIRLLPRMHDWVDDNYPGTKLALSEYDLSQGDVRIDNLIQAEVLGIFGRERLDLATLWPLLGADHYADAFRAFRDYDGAGGRFGETSVSSQSADQAQLAIYGAERASDGALTLVVINKTPGELTSTISLAGFTPAAAAQVWRWAGVAGSITRASDQPLVPGGFTATFPARTLSVVVIPPAGSGAGATGGETTGAPLPAGPAPATQTPGTATAPRRCRVPRLRGLTLKRAKRRLRRAHCRAGRVTRRRARARKGRVIRQRPRAGRRLKAGGRVALVLSRGR